MAHKTLVGGTAYNISGGKSMVSGTAYNIKSGRTLIGGTGYNIGFDKEASIADRAIFYNTGDFVFQNGASAEEGKTQVEVYTNFFNKGYTGSTQPWYSYRNNIINVYSKNEVISTNIAGWFNRATNLRSFSIMTNINLITNMRMSFSACKNLQMSPFCGDNVTDMYNTYYTCSNLIGSPVCGKKVTNMDHAYYACDNLTGSPVCGPSVIDMGETYAWCNKLTGSPVCGPNVTNMSGTYKNCRNLTGSPICGPNVTNMYNTYFNCLNIGKNAYFYSLSVNNAWYCFKGKSNTKRLNIYVPSGSTTNTTVHYNNTHSLIAANITWTNAGSYQYNTTYNIYIYPVANVAAAAIANGDEEANANAGIITGGGHSGSSG